jgi:hypothetical protein
MRVFVNGHQSEGKLHLKPDSMWTGAVAVADIGTGLLRHLCV